MPGPKETGASFWIHFWISWPESIISGLLIGKWTWVPIWILVGLGAHTLYKRLTGWRQLSCLGTATFHLFHTAVFWHVSAWLVNTENRREHRKAVPYSAWRPGQGCLVEPFFFPHGIAGRQLLSGAISFRYFQPQISLNAMEESLRLCPLMMCL